MLARRPSPADGDAVVDEAADDAGMAEYEAQGGISHKAMRTWLLSLGTDQELPSPKVGD